eukprot:COSAG02_NODE_43855_length_371_cov_0.753676_1_plen_63_part_10
MSDALTAIDCDVLLSLRKKKKKHKKEKEKAAAAMADGGAMLAAQPTTATGSGTILTSGTSVMG